MLYADPAGCGGVVPIVFDFLVLTIFKFTNLDILKTEVAMEQLKSNIFNKLIYSFFETFWAIGTSIAAAGVLHLLKI